jgi:predicted CDP-diglyceride synthetase/phosphatidate cytidylyltransferase
VSFLSQLGVIDYALLAALAITMLLAFPTARRGGRFRGLPGWVAFQSYFAALMISLDHLPQWFGLTLLALLMFFALRDYFFVAPVRMRDRYAVLATYIAIPFVISMAWAGSPATFLATVPVTLFLFIPVFLAFGRPEVGLLDSMGRTLLGVMIFVYCTGHLAVLTEVTPERLPGHVLTGLPQLLGILILASELPRRLAGGFEMGKGWGLPTSAVLVSVPLVLGLGYWLGPYCGLVKEDGARAGFFVLVAVTLGALVAGAVAVDLALKGAALRVGRGATLNRAIPAVYAIPVYFHYLNHFS